jgi:hypothetical protein
MIENNKIGQKSHRLSHAENYDDKKTQDFIYKYAVIFKVWKGDDKDYNRSEFLKQLEMEKYPSEDIEKIKNSEIIRRINKIRNQLVNKLKLEKFVDHTLGVKKYTSSIIKGDNFQVKEFIQHFDDEKQLWDGDFILTIGKNEVILTRDREPVIVKRWKNLNIDMYLTESKKASYFISGVKIAKVYEDSDGWIWEGNVYENENYFNIIIDEKIIYEITF